MKYKGFYIDITPDDHIVRSDSSGNEVICQGFSFSVFTDETRTEKFDEFTAAVGYEILAEDMEEAEQFAKDVVSCEDKTFRLEQPDLTLGGIS
ncbi:hypothetical protein SAMN02910447_03177 [Ruminococcus sp. YE71]|uniref:hypothetical protein n=1 Tax=unclassified Ruminococcus TaxID=2608920 RepID=UPI00088F1D30|nr:MULTISPECIES: hypothetical protein [unclassified Ruminococcus]SDA30347.1 hypothetical protein SAMN02910446_03248 [Ruminococcus sp. YE78]SFW49480.1 hypothetical protein SAMN02910447_03177 [Ruminococcus sp. YE71]